MQYNEQTVAAAERIVADNDDPKAKTLKFQFRWPVRQVGPKTIEVIIPMSDHGYGVVEITREFIEIVGLTKSEVLNLSSKLEDQALRSVAILKD